MGLFDWFKKKPEADKTAVANENALESVLRKSVTEPAYRPEFYRLLLSEELVVLTKPNCLEEGSYTLQEDTTVDISTLDDGRIPVFTSTDRIFDKGVIKEKVPFLAMKGADLFGLAKGAKYILNPYSDYGKELLAEEVTNMLDGTVLEAKHKQITIEKETQVLIGQPAIYPQKVVNSLRTLFSTKPVVKAAYLGWIHDPASADPPHLIIGLDLDGEDPSVTNEAGFTAYQHLQPDEIVDFIRIRNGGSLVDYFVRETTPFYVRA
jgi:hypothetical protein